MIILSVHNHYQQRGGEDESTELEVELLRSRGHTVVEYRKHNDDVEAMSSLHVAARTVWSRESYQEVRALIRDRRPDLVHVQNFFPLISPAVYYAARTERVPVVQTLRNFRLLCVNGLFLRRNKVCEDCLGRSGPLPGVVHGCYRGSRSASAAVAAMLVTHRAARTWTRMVDTYIALTDFSRSKFIEGGLPGHRIVVKPNFVHPAPSAARAGPGEYALFIGRLSEEKGIRTLLDAWRQLPGVPLKIVGTGPLEAEVARAINDQGQSSIEMLGHQSRSEVHSLLSDAAMLILPSLWYETFGRVAVEAYAAGVPVIASRLGSMAELVQSGVSGLHFDPGDPVGLASQVRWALAHPDEWQRMGRQARSIFESRYTADHNYEMLMNIYDNTQIGRAGS